MEKNTEKSANSVVKETVDSLRAKASTNEELEIEETEVDIKHEDEVSADDSDVEESMHESDSVTEAEAEMSADDSDVEEAMHESDSVTEAEAEKECETMEAKDKEEETDSEGKSKVTMDEASNAELNKLWHDYAGAIYTEDQGWGEDQKQAQKDVVKILALVTKTYGKAVADDMEEYANLALGNEEYEGDPEESAKTEKQMQALAKKHGIKESTKVAVDEEYVTAINTLAENDPSLTEDFRRQAATIFEAAVTSKVREHKEQLDNEFQTRLSESIEQVETDLTEKVDSYLNYVIEEWVKKNEIAIESGLRNELAEGFMNSLKALFTENYINVPESKKDLCSDLMTKNSELQNKLDESVLKQNELTEQVESLSREAIVEKVADGLAMTQVVKLKSLVEDVKFIDAGTFEEKVTTIKEAYFNTQSKEVTQPKAKQSNNKVQTIIEDKTLPGATNSTMDKYAKALSRQLAK